MGNMDSGFFLPPVQQLCNLLTFSVQCVARFLPPFLFAATAILKHSVIQSVAKDLDNILYGFSQKFA